MNSIETYEEGQRVKVYDVSRMRWFKAKILWIDRLDSDGKPDAWTCELANGNRGQFDKEHIAALGVL